MTKMKKEICQQPVALAESIKYNMPVLEALAAKLKEQAEHNDGTREMVVLLKRVLVEKVVNGISTGGLLFERGTYPTRAIIILRNSGNLSDGPIQTGWLLFKMAVHTIRKTNPSLEYTRIDCYATFGSGAADRNERSFLIVEVTDDFKGFQIIKDPVTSLMLHQGKELHVYIIREDDGTVDFDWYKDFSLTATIAILSTSFG